MAKVVQFVANGGKQVFHPGPLLKLGITLGGRPGIVAGLDSENGGDSRLGRELGHVAPQLPPGQRAVILEEVDEADAVPSPEVGF